MDKEIASKSHDQRDVLLRSVLGVGFALQVVGAFGNTVIASMVLYLKPAFGLSAVGVGLLSTCLYAGGVIVGLPAGRLVDRVGTRHAALVAAVFVGGGLAAAAAAPMLGVLLALLVII